VGSSRRHGPCPVCMQRKRMLWRASYSGHRHRPVASSQGLQGEQPAPKSTTLHRKNRSLDSKEGRVSHPVQSPPRPKPPANRNGPFLLFPSLHGDVPSTMCLGRLGIDSSCWVCECRKLSSVEAFAKLCLQTGVDCVVSS